jgi:hypothetical protein
MGARSGGRRSRRNQLLCGLPPSISPPLGGAAHLFAARRHRDHRFGQLDIFPCRHGSASVTGRDQHPHPDRRWNRPGRLRDWRMGLRVFRSRANCGGDVAARRVGRTLVLLGPAGTFRLAGAMARRRLCLAQPDGQRCNVAANSAATELYPTALRGTIIGWFAIANALGALTSHTTVSLLAGPLGGLSVVVGYLALVGLPGAVLYAVFIDETRGMTLEAASAEAPPRY